MRRSAVAVVVGLAAVLSSCSPGTSDVSGKVSLAGKPLASGSVMFTAADGMAAVAAIEPDGTYTLTGGPVGAVKVTVTSPNPAAGGFRGGSATRGASAGRGAPKAGGEAVAGWFAIPGKYAEPGTSGLATTLKAGSQTFNIDLTE